MGPSGSSKTTLLGENPRIPHLLRKCHRCCLVLIQRAPRTQKSSLQENLKCALELAPLTNFPVLQQMSWLGGKRWAPFPARSSLLDSTPRAPSSDATLATWSSLVSSLIYSSHHCSFSSACKGVVLPQNSPSCLARKFHAFMSLLACKRGLGHSLTSAGPLLLLLHAFPAKREGASCGQAAVKGRQSNP